MNQCSRCSRAELIGEKLFAIVPNPSMVANISPLDLAHLPAPPVYSCKACLTDAEICKLLAPAVVFVMEHALNAGVRGLADARASLIHARGPDAVRNSRKAALEALG